MSSRSARSTGFPVRYRDYGRTQLRVQQSSFKDSEVYHKYRRRVLESDNDFIMVIAAASKSAVSGVGKTTLGLNSGREMDASGVGFDAELKYTLNPSKFAKGMLTDQELVPNKSAVVYDEAQGTLSSTGIDSRRSMKQSVMDVTTALSTLRFRQTTAIIVSQSTDWIDKRIDNLLDALVLIQPRQSERDPIRAEVFETYYNDLEQNPTRYTEQLCTVTWPPLDNSDPDYEYAHHLKQQSALNQQSDVEADDDDELPKEKQMEIAQELRDNNFTAKEIAGSGLIEFGKDWVYKHTEAPSET